MLAMLNPKAVAMVALSLAALLLAAGCDNGRMALTAEPEVEATVAAEPEPTATQETATSVAEPDPTATAKPDEPPPASPTPEPTETSIPSTATQGLSPLIVENAPEPGEPRPSGWRTYYNGEFGFSVDHPQYELVRDEPTGPYLQERLNRNRGIWVTIHEVAGVDPLSDFAHHYRNAVVEREGLESSASEISLTEDIEDGRRFFSMNYISPADPGRACETWNFERITLAYAYPEKPYAFVISVGRCTENPNPLEPSMEKDLNELGVAMRSFREWNIYRDEELGWSFSAAPGWTSEGWVESHLSAGGPSLSRFNSGLYFIEDGSKGDFLVEVHRLSEDRLSEFADKYRDLLLSRATEQDSALFEMSSVTTTLYRGQTSAHYRVREQTTEEFCVEQAEVRHILVEPQGYGKVVITTTGGVCESASADVAAARDAMMDALRP